ncbi:MAG TPA: TMEM175 family protein [Bacteroidia bacterium]|nr:TMEM175 family protein [Bacteroidia bacterium]
MSKARLEAFSDGVFAIVITLLILDVHIPRGVSYEELPHALAGMIPNILTYILSFIIVGLYWISHHQILGMMEKINRPIMWMNILGLMTVSFIPFPASLIGEFPMGRLPVVFYGCSLLTANFTGFIAWYYMSRCRQLLRHDVTPQMIRAMNLTFLSVNVAYLVAIGVAFLSVIASYSIFLLVILLLIVRKPWEKHHHSHKSG